ncbi:MAG TPA: DUF6338 family protein [Pirellulales bacterium]|jgi:hypothetical protein|nr:DUF6338 family protein [Pirellulales bacterium]
MEALSAEIINLLNTLVPGFLAAWIFYGLTAHPRKEPFERVVQALIFTVIIRGLTIIVRWFALLLGHLFVIGEWTNNVDLVWSLLIGAAFGLGVAGCANNNTIHCFLWNRRWNFRKRRGDDRNKGWVWTKRTAYPNEWFSAFHQEDRNIVLHLKGSRRLYGWAEEWPDSPDSGHFVMINIEWLDDDNVRHAQDRVSRLLLSATDVEMVEFVKYESEITVAPEIVEQRQKELIVLQKKGTAHGKQVSTAASEPGATAPNKLHNGEPVSTTKT